MRASADAGPYSQIAFRLTESHGFERVMQLHVTIAERAPSGVVTPNNINIGLSTGKVVKRTFTLTNKGLAAWQGVTLSTLPVSWMWFEGSGSIGDIPAGGSAQVSVTFAPPAEVGGGIANYYPLFEVYSVNNDTVPVGAVVTTTSSLVTQLRFEVASADKVTTDPWRWVSGATVKVYNRDLPAIRYSVKTDGNGVAQFNDLPSGRYGYSVSAEGYMSVSSNTVLEAGKVQGESEWVCLTGL